MATNKKKTKKRGRTDAAAKGRQRGRRGDGEKGRAAYSKELTADVNGTMGQPRI
jgi:hypothetical protein